MSNETKTMNQGFFRFFFTAGCDNFAHAVKKSGLAALWFVFLTFPIMVIKVNTIEKTVVWHWHKIAYVAVAIFFGSFLWRWLLARKELKKDDTRNETGAEALLTRLQSHPIVKYVALGALLLAAALFPKVVDLYQTNIMISCLVYIVLGLGLNIVVGLAGLLDLGYVAFYAVGAYAYALCNMHWDIGF